MRRFVLISRKCAMMEFIIFQLVPAIDTFVATFNNATTLITKTGCKGIKPELGHPQFGIYSLLLAIQIVR